MTTWTTKSGERMQITDMDNNHLINSIKYIKRNAAVYKDRLLDSLLELEYLLTGDQALYDIKKDTRYVHSLNNKEFIQEFTPINELIKEAHKRKLQID